MSRDSRLSFKCNRCSRCCYNKKIKVNPYEVARLAANLGLDTTTFIQQHTVNQGTALRSNADGSCEFLSSNGCVVHADRPFVCRLYPLLRRVDRTGMETFATVKLHPQCEGEWGEDGTIGKYLAGQQAEDYIYAVDAYLELTAKIVATLNALTEEPLGSGAEVGEVPERPAVIDMEEVVRWLDIDFMLSRPEGDERILNTTNATDKMHEHISLIETKLKSIKGKG